MGARCIRMELGAPDASGRPPPVPKPGSEFEVEATAIIAAISQEPEFDGFVSLRAGKDWIKTDEWGTTSAEGVYAGGDDVELGLVTIAISQGRFAAEAIDARLRGKPLEKPVSPPPIPRERVKLDWYKGSPRHERAHIGCRAAHHGGGDRVGLVRGGGAGRSQALHVVRNVHGLRELLDVLHQ